MDHQLAIKDRGFTILKNVFDPPSINELLTSTTAGLTAGTTENIKTSLGETYAARNLIKLAPELATMWQRDDLVDVLQAILGQQVGLVRVLYFDKHPNRTWTLPWHQDMTIAVEDNTLPTTQFCKPTTKSGVPHVEAPENVLHQMLTLRIHLDEVTEDNGPLKVIRGSHQHKLVEQSSTASSPSLAIDTIYAAAGDVLAMRPLISHSSGASKPGTSQHRRILHLEFSGQPQLPDGFQWYHFIAI